MFKNDAQCARACQALCNRVRLGRMWTPTGPSEEACAVLAANGGPLSSGERVIVLATFALWNGDGTLTFADLFRLDSDNLLAIGIRSPASPCVWCASKRAWSRRCSIQTAAASGPRRKRSALAHQRPVDAIVVEGEGDDVEFVEVGAGRGQRERVAGMEALHAVEHNTIDVVR